METYVTTDMTTDITAAVLRLGDPVPQYANALELHLDRVAGLHGVRGAGRSRIDDVAGQQRHVVTHVARDPGDGEDQIARALRLHRLAVEPRLKQQVIVVQPRDDDRAERPEGVGRLRAEPLEVTALPIALADVVAGSDPEDVRLGGSL